MLPLPRLPAHWAGCWGPLPTCCGRGRVGVGAQHCPPGLHALWELRAAGVVGGPPPTWLGAVRPPWGGSVAFVCQGAGWRGGGRAPRPSFVRPGGPVGRGVALPRSVPLPSLGRQQSGCHWRRSGYGGHGPHTIPVRARPPSLGAICAASWRVDAGLLVPRGSCGSRRLGRGGGPCSGSFLGRGEGGPSLLPRGPGAGAPAACGNGGGVGGGVAPRPPCSPSGGRPAVPYPRPPLVVGALPLGVCVSSGSRARPGGGGGMRNSPWTASPGAPTDLNPPSALTEWAMVMGGVMKGAASILFWCAVPRLGPRAAPAR